MAADTIVVEGGAFNPERVIPIVFGNVPREHLTLPYYRAYDEWDYAESIARGHDPKFKLVTSYDQDPELRGLDR